MPIAENLARVQEQIVKAARRAERDPALIKLVAVSKTFPPADIVRAVEAGARNIGENRVEEAAAKIPQAASQLSNVSVRWHLIGHLQRRKAREAVALFDMIQSVDSVRLAETLNRYAAQQGKTLPVLLQVNIGQDPQKFGFLPDPRNALLQAVASIVTLPNLRVEGLMTIGPLVPTPEQARPYFRDLRLLRDELARAFPGASWGELSMGMTDDFGVAIEEGATIVRIGRAIFGQRTEERSL